MSSPGIIPRARLSALIGIAILHGCASSAPRPDEQSQAQTGPLAGLVGRQLAVFPAQYVALPGSSGSWDVAPHLSGLLPILDEELADTFRQRGVKSNWTFAPDLIASAERNSGLTGDPRSLSAAGIRRVRAGDTPLPEPLASQIRGLVAFTNARYALVPLEVRVDAREGRRQAWARVLLVDARTARVVWADDVEGEISRDPATVSEALTPYGFRVLSRGLMARLADMVVAQ